MNKNVFWYLGYVLALILVITLFVGDLNKSTEVILTMLFTLISSITFAITTHNKRMKKDKDYRVGVKDERNSIIREKTSHAIVPIYMLLFGIQAIYGIANDLYVVTIFSGSVIILSPLIMILISEFYEKRF